MVIVVCIFIVDEVVAWSFVMSLLLVVGMRMVIVVLDQWVFQLTLSSYPFLPTKFDSNWVQLVALSVLAIVFPIKIYLNQHEKGAFYSVLDLFKGRDYPHLLLL
jgi:hypothetical protein